MKSIDYRDLDLIFFLFFLTLTTIGVGLFKFFPTPHGVPGFVRDTLGNIGGVLTASSLFIWYKGYRTINSRMWVISSVFLGFVVYEVIQVILPWATFDLLDIIGTFIGSLIAVIINILIITNLKQQQ